MIIQSVELKNYRIHAELKVTFDEGINLLLGQNGAGKSSILEALGFALFDSDLRTKGNERAIRNGAKSASVVVRFVGNDSNEYRVERRIGTTARWQLFFGEESAPRYVGKDQVLPVIRTLSGIHQNEDQIFTTVICAVQNRFVDMFNLTPQNREDTFNRLFDTDIYRKLSQNFAGGDDSITSKYKELLDQLNGRISSMEEIAVDESAVEAEIVQCQVVVNQKSSEREQIELRQKNREQHHSQLAETVRHFTVLEQELNFLEKEIINFNGVISETTRLITESEKSAAIVTKNQPEFDRYLSLKSERDQREQVIADEPKIRNQFDTVVTTLSQNAIQLEKLHGDSKNIDVRSAGLSSQIAELTSQISSIDSTIVEKDRLLAEVIEKGVHCKSLVERYEDLVRKIGECEDLLNRTDLAYQEQCTRSARTADLESKIANSVQQEAQLTHRESELQSINNQIREKEIELNALEDARTALGTGVCPILRESCQNVSTGTGAVSYFDSRKVELQSSLQQFYTTRIPLESVPAELRELRESITAAKLKFQESKEAEVQAKSLAEQILTLRERLTLLLDQSTLIEPESPVNNEKSSLVERWEFHKGERVRLLQIYKDTESQRKELESQRSSIAANVQQIEQNRIELAKEREKIVIGIETLRKESESFEIQKGELSGTLDRYSRVREEITQIAHTMSDTENGYRQVLENRELAARTGELKENLASTNQRLEETTSRKIALQGELAIFSRETVQQEIQQVSEELVQIRKIHADISTELTVLSERIRQNGEILQKSRAEKERVLLLKNERIIVQRKLELTEIFRRNINEMGRFVVAGIVETVAAEATVHFQKFTGRSERIDWVVDDTEKYAVYLVNGDFRREFSVLSGGEQVAVALSLRASLAHELAAANFAIFDEPTVNLDSERKVALAESIKSMVGMLGQTIIVTHDDLFREMAQKVIEL